MSLPSRPRVFLDVNIGEEPAGRLTIELFVDKTPKTCENFRRLCTGEHEGLNYSKAPFHRVIDEFMVQGGDIERGDGTGTVSIYGGEFEDENLNWREMDAAGLVCSANRGKDTNGSQFFITLEPCPHLNGKHTIFGRLAAGDAVLQKIAKVEVDKNDRPTNPVLVARSGELEKRKKPAQAQERATSRSEKDRGRTRRSNSADEDMVDADRSGKKRGGRRQSDNVVDEGLRGRPRQRTHSRSPSNALTSTSESASVSPHERHKRKRSPSPSRHVNAHDDERRRRSLPNQYAKQSDRSGYEDDTRYRPSPRRYHDRDRHTNYRQSERERRYRDEERYRSTRDQHGGRGDRNSESGRLGYSGDGEGGDPPVKFKGRGIMKYREVDRAW